MPEKRGGEFLRGLAWNIPASIGAPADLAETVLNLGLAGGGYLGHKLGLLGADQLPQLLEGSPGTTKWWAKGTPMEESTDPAFVRGQLTGGLAAAAYGMLPQMRMRQGQLNVLSPTPYLPDSLNDLKRKLGASKQHLTDDEGRALLLFRGTNEPEAHGLGVARPGYAVFSSDNPYIASSYVREPTSPRSGAGAVFPFTLRPDVKLKVFPVGKNFDKFAFDTVAKRLGKGEVLVAEKVVDPGPGWWPEPFSRRSQLNNQFAFVDPDVAQPLYQGKLPKPDPVMLRGGELAWKNRRLALSQADLRELETKLPQHPEGREYRPYTLTLGGDTPVIWEPQRAGALGELERVKARIREMLTDEQLRSQKELR